MSAGRRAWLGAASAALCTVLLVAPAVAAQGGSGPSAGAIAHSKRVVGTRTQQVRSAAAAVARGKAELHRLNLIAEVAAESYDAAEVRLRAARAALRTADLVLAGANRRVATGRARVGAFATQAYENGGLSSIDAFLADGGTAAMVRRFGALEAISVSQRDTLQQLDADQIYSDVVRHRAEQLHRQSATAATAAAQARAAAAAAVGRQTALLASTAQRERTLTHLLAGARDQASRLEHEHLAALARAQARAVARRERARRPPVPEPAPTPVPPTGGSTAGTVSAAVGAAAVHVAEAQIGKPYVWAAAGPNSFDCSGLTMFAYAQEGVHLDHFTGDQWQEGVHLSQSQLRPGDLVFFAYDTSNPATIHHVGMYIGDGDMVQAPETGENVMISPYDRPDYIGAVRPYQQ